MVNGKSVSISSIDEAISYLVNEYSEMGTKDVEFLNWPNIDIKIYGSRYNGDLTPELAKGIYDFSICLRKAYASLKYGSADLRGRRSREDQEIFDSFLFSVGEGCTSISAWLGKAATKMLTDLGKEAISKMNSRDVMIVSVALIVALFGGYTVAQIASTVRDGHQEDAMVSALAENRKTVAELLENLPEVQLAKINGATQHVHEAHEKIIKAAPDADQINIGQNTYTKEDIQRINSGEEKITNSEEIKDDLVLVEGITKNIDNLTVAVKIHSERFPGKTITLKYNRGYLDTVSEVNLHKALQKSPFVKVKINYHAIFNEDGHEFLRGTLISVSDIVNVDAPINSDADES